MKFDGAIRYLSRQQRTRGNFDGQSGPNVDGFEVLRKQPTVFPTTLILDCLIDVPGCEALCARAARYIRGQISAQGSWNYWQQNSAARQSEPYPDDLDDTACAIAALTKYDASRVTGSMLGQFGALLVSAEQQPGGPYNTWLIDVQQSPQWRHIDVAVNANVAYALSLHGVTLQGCERYLEQAIISGRLQSDYYVGIAPVLYFMARIQSENLQPIIKDAVVKMLQSVRAMPALQAALLLSAGCFAGVPKKYLTPLATILKQSYQEQHWLAAALYVDPVYDRTQYYGGSAELTTAFALQALALYDKPANLPKLQSKQSVLPAELQAAVNLIPDKTLREAYTARASGLLTSSEGVQVAQAASCIAESCSWKTPAEVQAKLNTACLNGWIAYSAYDDVIDEQNRQDTLGVANVALRRSYHGFMEALPRNYGFQDLVNRAFDIMDAANTWELQYARSNRQIVLPDYGDLQQLADKSWGHSLAATGVFMRHFVSLDHPRVKRLQTFFRHFLIARQLNDDAHDWEADLQAGQYSAVVTMLLKDHFADTILPAPEDISIPDLRRHFWEHTLNKVARLIRKHLAKAAVALDEMQPDFNREACQVWLDELEQAVEIAVKKRDETLAFMKSFEGIGHD